MTMPFFLFCLCRKGRFFDYPHIDVATLNGDIVGFSAYTDDELAWLYVSPKAMRKGIGKRLAQKAIYTGPNIQYIEVLYGNEPARKLYESLGFHVQETVQGVMPGNESFKVKVYRMCRA